MTVPLTSCNAERIERFFRHQLDDDEQQVLEEHLTECPHCQQQLELAAADGVVWDGVRAALSANGLFTEEPSPDLSSSIESPGRGALACLNPSDDERMLGRLGAYEVMGVIGSGGFGYVFKALDPALNRHVAIKVLAPHLSDSAAARRRFLREAQAAAAVVHHNVIEIYGVAETQGLPFLVMTYVRGPSLQRRLDANGVMEIREVLRVGMQSANGLAAAHAQGLVHRDVKPANILLEDGVERVKLTDFGMARAADDASLTKTGVIAGTPQYMSPEQAKDDSIDARSDLFSLGSVLYSMCAGRMPFRAETSYGTLRRVVEEEPRALREINPDVPWWLEAIIARLHAKSPDDRYQTAAEVADLLEQCLAHLQQPHRVELPQIDPVVRRRQRSWAEAAKADELVGKASRGVGRVARALLIGAIVPIVGIFAVVYCEDAQSLWAEIRGPPSQ